MFSGSERNGIGLQILRYPEIELVLILTSFDPGKKKMLAKSFISLDKGYLQTHKQMADQQSQVKFSA